MEFLTDFADEAVILPLAATIAVVLAALGWWRGALAWTVSVSGVLGTMGFLKVLFVACYEPLSGLGIHSPSGHTAAATVTYGGILLLLGRGRVPMPLLVLVPPAITVVIAITRVSLGAHVPVETVVGGVVGLLGAAVLLPLAGPRPALRSWPVAVVVLAIMLCFHGMRLQAEQTIHNFAYLSWLPLSAMCRA
ncbi:phosphatase PAP2 family protein [Acidisphaera sp. L21]|uniref:phosphatase PAP2 family protein n=1 Tax=Acidisphaera sp. L21 TaxID=1641851 RepID=UPI00131BA930|nr:phosphatase PAP2 family protein [Acidisphaera sp. L21]